MKLKLEINNIAKSSVPKAFIKKVITKTLEKSGYSELVKKNLTLSLAWISKEEMQKINKLYRKKNCATDILSFCEYECAEKLEKTKEQEIFLGELVLCYNYIKESLPEHSSENDLQKELARIIAHGVLHLLGFLHGKKMFTLQDSVAEEV